MHYVKPSRAKLISPGAQKRVTLHIKPICTGWRAYVWIPPRPLWKQLLEYTIKGKFIDRSLKQD